ncbi:L-lysine-aminomutase [Biscogniauxia mediterranea]|nr:L-lysine-aminomutase [Biscogniauxia mediterranea]
MASFIFRSHQTLAKAVARLAITTPQPTQVRHISHAISGHRSEFWRDIRPYRDVSREQFMSWNWNIKNVLEKKKYLWEFLYDVLPGEIPRVKGLAGMQSRDDFMVDINQGIRASAMSVRVMPYILSRINWQDPANDPLFRQFIPLKSVMVEDLEVGKLDSLNEKTDSPVEGIVHRYPDKALFLPVSVCPTYCIFCTRSYGIGGLIEQFIKKPFKMSMERLEQAFEYIEKTEGLHDVVVSGGDAFYLHPHMLEKIGDRLIGMKNIERFRFASKGLAVAPQRFLDDSDPWTATLIRISDKARQAGKHMALHTHFNHPNEISWITEEASFKLLRAGLTVRNQSVLLKGVNDKVETMETLIKQLSKMVVIPYYVYQCDQVLKIEHFRTPLSVILDMEKQIQGKVAGFMTPKFVVDLPGGGGKRLAHTYESYNRETGIATFRAPAIPGKEDQVYHYHDPVNQSTT